MDSGCNIENSKKAGLQNVENATTKPNSSTIHGGCNKKKFALWAHPGTLEEVANAYEEDNCKSKSEFIEKAIKFYLGYLKQERNVNYLSTRITSTMEAIIAETKQQMNRNLFKIAVELGKISHMVAAANGVDDETLQELHAMCADEVRRINGVISYESAVRFQND